MEQVLLLHRRSKNPWAVPVPVWKTCLRQIAILGPTESEALHPEMLEPGDEVFEGERAFVFLIEVLCGLHSPVLGETEVFGQFRRFVEERGAEGHEMYTSNGRWLQAVFQAVKEIRSKFANGMGAHSYGSLLRRHLRQINFLSLLGSGHLARELLPWIARGRQIQLFSRDPEKVLELKDSYAQLTISDYSQPILGHALIVAAPLADQLLVDLLARAKKSHIPLFDLRGENSNIEELLPHTVTLARLFAELNDLRRSQGQRIQAISHEIQRYVRQKIFKPELRPLGWEDLYPHH